MATASLDKTERQVDNKSNAPVTRMEHAALTCPQRFPDMAAAITRPVVQSVKQAEEDSSEPIGGRISENRPDSKEAHARLRYGRLG